jgi:hypothetical protein
LGFEEKIDLAAVVFFALDVVELAGVEEGEGNAAVLVAQFAEVAGGGGPDFGFNAQ